MEETAREELAGDNFAGLDALAMTATELQEGEGDEREEGVAAAPEEEWLAEGPQAPAPDPDQCTRTRAAARGAATSNPAPSTKRVFPVALSIRTPETV